MKKIEIIAEIGQNHNGDIDLALDMIEEVKNRGADVAKFQLYDAVALFPKEDNPWYDYNCKTEITKDQLHKLVEKCEQVGIEFMASVFDEERLEWLEEIGIKRHKVASRTINDPNLIDKVLSAGKDTLISLGMWDGEGFPKFEGYSNYEFLFCVSKYPTPLTDIKWANIDFSKYVGFSDHTLGVSAPITAITKGSMIIEKHYTQDKEMYGPDHSCSMTGDELEQIARFRNDYLEMI